MKKIISWLLCLTLIAALAMTTFAADGQGESAGEQGESAGEQGESAGEQGESAGDQGGPQGGESGMDGNQVSTAAAPEGAVHISSGEKILDGEVISVWEGSAVQNSGTSVIVARNCEITGDTVAETTPVTGNPGNLLIAGSIRTTIALGQGQSFYINSKITTKNWAALATDGAEPALSDDEKELSLYAYGTEAIALEGGYGAYSDLFCNFYSYASNLQSAEIGIISGTYGSITIGTAAEGEANEELAAHLIEEDMAAHEDKEEGSVITAGRNAIMIHSVNLPPYWEYEGYSEEELPLYSTPVYAHASTLKTDLSLNKGIEYEAQKQAFIDHSAGSVILIKSTNTDIVLDACELIADEAGTGNIIQTVYNNDTMFMNAVPDGEEYPGVNVTMKDMEVEGNVVHEDYQRKLVLTLQNSILSGAVNEYDCAHWNEVSAAEGFTDFCLDASYETHHGAFLVLTEGSVWNVTAESSLTGLTIEEGCIVNGSITVDGEVVEGPGTYEGSIIVTP